MTTVAGFLYAIVNRVELKYDKGFGAIEIDLSLWHNYIFSHTHNIEYMPTYTQSNTDPVSVNGMFLKFYLDVMLGMTETFKDQNRGGFNLYAMFLRSCVPGKERRDEIDNEMVEINEKIQEGVFGELGTQQADFIRGFCVVSASTKFLNDAFHITTLDASAAADTTDEELIVQLEKYMMYKKVKNELKNDKARIKELELRIADGSIPNLAELTKEITAPDEAIPQDDHITQMEGDTIDSDEG